MLKVVLLTSALALSTTLAGCAQLLANASGSEPVGKTTAERTLSQRIEDMSIERTASINLYKTNPEVKNSHIVFMSFHSNVLIAGQALNALQKQQAEAVLRNIGEVDKIHNELVVTPNMSSYLSRAKDNVLQMQLGSKLTFMEGFPSSQAKILVEDGTVYLMAKLTKAQTQQAVDVIKTMPDIKKLVKLIDYLD